MGKKRRRSDDGDDDAFNDGESVAVPAAAPTADVAPAAAVGGGDEDAEARRARRRAAKAAKRAKLLAAQQTAGGLAAIVTPQAAVAHPFEALDEDAAETPLEAYRDIEPLLFRLALALGKTKETLRIWDPFYACGSVVKHFARLGFTRCINENKDFYATVRNGLAPEFDVLVTNPPFSGNHMARILEYAQACGRPFFLLLPEFVEDKAYYAKYVDRCAAEAAVEAPPASSSSSSSSSSAAPPPLSAPVYVGPAKRPYQFSAPGRSLDGTKPFVERQHHAELPFQVFACKFQCVWFCQLRQHRAPVVGWWRKKYEGTVPAALSDTSAADLPQLSKAAKQRAAAAAVAAADGGGDDDAAAAGGGSAAAAAATAAGAPLRAAGSKLQPSERQQAHVPTSAAGDGSGGMSRNAWRKKLSRQRKQAAKASLLGGGGGGGAPGR